MHQEKHEHKDMEKYHHQKQTATKQAKKPLFSPVFLPPRRSGKIFEDNSCAATKCKMENTEKWAKKQKPRKAENAIFPLIFWWFKKQELISGPRGGVFLIQLGRRGIFFSTFFGGPISKAECTQTILYYKNSGFGTFWAPKKWAKN